MNLLRKVFLLQLITGIRPRLLSRSVDKGSSQKDKTPSDPSKDEKKGKDVEDLCGKVVLPTGPRCKNKPGDAKPNDKPNPSPKN